MPEPWHPTHRPDAPVFDPVLHKPRHMSWHAQKNILKPTNNAMPVCRPAGQKEAKGYYNQILRSKLIVAVHIHETTKRAPQ